MNRLARVFLRLSVLLLVFTVFAQDGMKVEFGPMGTITYWARMAEDAGQIHAAGWWTKICQL